jgi:hypothetical protein
MAFMNSMLPVLPVLTPKREAWVETFEAILKDSNGKDTSLLHQSIKEKTLINFKVDKKTLKIKYHTPSWVNLLVAFDNVNKTNFFAQELEAGLVNKKGNYYRKGHVGSDSDDTTPKTPKTKTSKTPKTSKPKPPVGQLKIGTTVQRFTGDLDAVVLRIRELIEDGTLKEKLPRAKKSNDSSVDAPALSEERVVDSDSDEHDDHEFESDSGPKASQHVVKNGPRSLDHDSEDDSESDDVDAKELEAKTLLADGNNKDIHTYQVRVKIHFSVPLTAKVVQKWYDRQINPDLGEVIKVYTAGGNVFDLTIESLRSLDKVDLTLIVDPDDDGNYPIHEEVVGSVKVLKVKEL